MKKKCLAMLLAAVLAVSLLPGTAFAVGTTTVTAAGISFNTMTTDRYENWKSASASMSESFGWADNSGPEDEFRYLIGWINYGPDDGVRNFWPYLVGDDVTLDFHVKEGEKFYIEGYSLSLGESLTEFEHSTVYVATFMGGATFTAPEDDWVIDKAIIDQVFPGANYLFCCRGDYDPNVETIEIVFADKDATPNTYNGASSEPEGPAEPAEPEEPETPDVTFSDVSPTAYYAPAVAWAAANKITGGYPDGTFDPNGDCTRAQIVTFLWRANGEQEPTATENPFTDLDPNEYYYKAVLWAVENGITSGYPDGTFDPNGTCNRAQAVTFQYRAEKKPPVTGSSSFIDVPAGEYYADAVAWAAANKITSGTGDGTTFSPDDNCSRAQIVTFLYNQLGDKD